MHFLRITALSRTPSHFKVYGGVSQGKLGMHHRRTAHDTEIRRGLITSFHHSMASLPDSWWRVFAFYPSSSPLGSFLLNEGFMIARFGLYKDQAFLSFLSIPKFPTAMRTSGAPIIGLNRDPGLDWYGGAPKTEEELFKVKAAVLNEARQLVTTGVSINLGARGMGTINFQLLSVHDISINTMMRMQNPSIYGRKTAIVVIDLMPSAVHANAY
jgi:hypothetical protein